MVVKYFTDPFDSKSLLCELDIPVLPPIGIDVVLVDYRKNHTKFVYKVVGIRQTITLSPPSGYEWPLSKFEQHIEYRNNCEILENVNVYN